LGANTFYQYRFVFTFLWISQRLCDCNMKGCWGGGHTAHFAVFTVAVVVDW
jgi:hypothetical protein